MRTFPSSIKMQCKNSFVTLLTICCIILSHLPPPTSCRPQDVALQTKQCQLNDRIQETCQKCAKITKSPLVYPMCCSNDEGVYSWCEQYVYYGIH